MKLALVQMSNSGSIESNLKKSIQALKEASHQGAHLVLFPEVQLTEFFPQYPSQDVRNYALTLDSKIVKEFCKVCKEYHIYAVPNIYLLENGKTYDASLFIDDQGIIVGIQKMVHVAQAKQFYEQDYYTPSNEGFKVFDTPYGHIGIVVCFDRHYPESIRSSVLQGADLILIPTVNTKSEPSEMFEWELKVQAFQNSVAIAMCNRVGEEGHMCFSGESVIIDAYGKTVKKANDQEIIVYQDVDLSLSKKVRDSKPYTQLRRIEFYK